jgi:hypothetical protein
MPLKLHDPRRTLFAPMWVGERWRTRVRKYFRTFVGLCQRDHAFLYPNSAIGVSQSLYTQYSQWGKEVGHLFSCRKTIVVGLKW